MGLLGGGFIHSFTVYKIFRISLKLINHLDKSIMKYKSHHFINILLYVIKKHSCIQKIFLGVYFVQIFCPEKNFRGGGVYFDI